MGHVPYQQQYQLYAPLVVNSNTKGSRDKIDSALDAKLTPNNDKVINLPTTVIPTICPYWPTNSFHPFQSKEGDLARWLLPSLKLMNSACVQDSKYGLLQ